MAIFLHYPHANTAGYLLHVISRQSKALKAIRFDRNKYLSLNTGSLYSVLMTDPPWRSSCSRRLFCFQLGRSALKNLFTQLQWLKVGLWNCRRSKHSIDLFSAASKEMKLYGVAAAPFFFRLPYILGYARTGYDAPIFEYVKCSLARKESLSKEETLRSGGKLNESTWCETTGKKYE